MMFLAECRGGPNVAKPRPVPAEGVSGWGFEVAAPLFDPPVRDRVAGDDLPFHRLLCYHRAAPAPDEARHDQAEQAGDDQDPADDVNIDAAQVHVCEAKHEGADRAQGAGPTAPFGSGYGGVVAGEEVAMPAQDGVRAHQQPKLSQRVGR